MESSTGSLRKFPQQPQLPNCCSGRHCSSSDPSDSLCWTFLHHEPQWTLMLIFIQAGEAAFPVISVDCLTTGRSCADHHSSSFSWRSAPRLGQTGVPCSCCPFPLVIKAINSCHFLSQPRDTLLCCPLAAIASLTNRFSQVAFPDYVLSLSLVQ